MNKKKMALQLRYMSYIQDLVNDMTEEVKDPGEAAEVFDRMLAYFLLIGYRYADCKHGMDNNIFMLAKLAKELALRCEQEEEVDLSNYD